MRKIIVTLALLLFYLSTLAQNRDVIDIYFDQGSSTIEKSLTGNKEMLDRLESTLKGLTSESSATITKIDINSYTSPEGASELNDTLSEQRAQAICDYIESLNLDIPTSSIVVRNKTTKAWEELRRIVSESEMADREQIIKIIDEIPEEKWAKTPNSRWLELVDSRNKHLMELNQGTPYRYMLENIYPSLRRSSVTTYYTKSEVEIEVAEQVEPKVEVQIEPKEQAAEEQEKVEVAPVALEPSAPITQKTSEPKRPLQFALKTNLLYDVATMLNIELEAPIGERWSLSGEWIFPWWTSCNDNSNKSSNRNTLQLLQGNIEAKYWFGDRTNRPIMTGWFAGLYGGAGKYDLEHKAEGYQGEFFAAGLSGGYAHTINKSGNLRMEYSLGVGYMQTDYRYYTEHIGIDDKWHTVREHNGQYSWIGPTKAKISLVWMLNKQRK